MLNTKLICVGMIAMLLVSCTYKPVGQKQDTFLSSNEAVNSIAPDNPIVHENPLFPTMKMEKVSTHPPDRHCEYPLLLQGSHYFYRDPDYNDQESQYVAVDINSKKIQWAVEYPDLDYPSPYPPQIIQDLVLFPSCLQSKYTPKTLLLAIDIDNGSKRWQCNLDDTIIFEQAMTLVQNILFVACWTDFYALDFKTGKVLWRKSIYDFFPGYSKKSDYYHIDTIGSNQSDLFITYAFETDMTKEKQTKYKGCLAIQPDGGSIRWKYETEDIDWSGYQENSLEVIGAYLFVFNTTLLDTKNGKMICKYKPEKTEYKNPETYYIGYISSAQLLIYRTTYEVGSEGYGTTIIGLDSKTGLQKWSQDMEGKDNPSYCQSLFSYDENHQTNQIFKFNSRDVKGEKGYQTQINSMDVYDGQTGKLLQSYELPVSSWFRDLKSEVRFHEGWWYFIGETSTDGGYQDNLFRFQLRK